MVNRCIWCGGRSAPVGLEPILFKGKVFHACSSDCQDSTLRYLAVHKRANGIWKWVALPATILYVSITGILTLSGALSFRQINLVEAILLIWAGFHFLVYPLLPNLNPPIPEGWRNIRATIKLKIILGIAFFLMAALYYFS